MEPSGPTSGVLPPSTRATGPTAPPPLQVGQLLQATVVENTAGKLLLALSHRQLSAESSLPFKPGQVLTLEVRSLGEQPVLRVIAALQESATASAIRTLLPRYGASTPLLASVAQLAQAPAGSLPPALNAVIRTLVRELPDRSQLSSAEGVKNAIGRSGSFLEQNLVQASSRLPTPAVLAGDFKAALLRLQGLLRELPAENTPAPTARRPPAAPPGGSPSAPATAATPTAQTPAREPPTAAAHAGGVPRKEPTGASAPLPQAVQRALRAAGNALSRPVSSPVSSPGPSAAPSLGTGASAGTVPGAAGQPAPPLPGGVPTAQVPVVAPGLDALGRLGQLRADLLQQTEAALTRIHLNQIASLARDGEPRLAEWLFDLPIRRGGDIDLWSARLYRDGKGNDEKPEQTAPSWSVQLAFDLPGLGPLQAQINLRGEQVSTHFRAARQETLPLLHAHLHELRRAMLAVGLEVGEINCRFGSLQDSDRSSPGPLINERA